MAVTTAALSNLGSNPPASGTTAHISDHDAIAVYLTGGTYNSVTYTAHGSDPNAHTADAAAGTASFRTLGTGAQQAVAGTHVATATGIHGVTGNVVGTTDAQTLTNKTLTSPVISQITNTGTLTLPVGPDTLVSRTSTDTLTNKTLTSPVISTIVNTGTLTLPTTSDTLVGRATTDTLTNKTLTAPTIATITNSGTLTLPVGPDTLVSRTSTDTLTNKTLTTPTIASFVNANHTHATGAGGGQLTQANSHQSPDTDAATTSLHHTLGTSATQAATGNHTHPGGTGMNYQVVQVAGVAAPVESILDFDTSTSATSVLSTVDDSVNLRTKLIIAQDAGTTVASVRTLGTGSQQAAAGNHSHGAGGSVVTTTDTQTLTNKTMDGASNTFTNIAQSGTHASPDTDTGANSLHHTLGSGANQAAAGNHAHDVSGSTVNLANHIFATNAGSATFNYTGQGGQPTWLWGTNDGTNFYVWNPGNFTVANVPWTGVTGRPTMAWAQSFFNANGGGAPALNASGQGTVTHGLGGTPSTVVVTHYTGGGTGSPIVCTVTNISSTTFTFRATNGGASYTSASNYFWFAAL